MLSENRKVLVIVSVFGFLLFSGMANAWNISSAEYETSFDYGAWTSPTDDSVYDIFFKSDGTEMFVGIVRVEGGYPSGAWEIFELEEPWNVSTATHIQTVGGSTLLFNGFYFKQDGTIAWEYDRDNGKISQYTYGDPWNETSICDSEPYGYLYSGIDSCRSTYNAQSGGLDIFVGPNNFYIPIDDDIKQYSINNKWNITGGSSLQKSVSFDVSNIFDVFIKPDGSKMFLETWGGGLQQYSLSVPWDTQSAVLEKSISSKAGVPEGLYISPNGEHMYIVGRESMVVKQFSLTPPTEEEFDLLNLFPFLAFILSPFVLFLLYVISTISVGTIFGYYINGFIGMFAMLLMTLLFTLMNWIPAWIGVLLLILLMATMIYFREFLIGAM